MSEFFWSVVIPTCQRREFLTECLRRLTAGGQTCPADQFEIIVSDDSPTAETSEWIVREFSTVRWVQGPRRGPAANRNFGASMARGAWLVFLDDDCLPDPGWLEGYRQTALEQPSQALLEGRVYVDCPAESCFDTAPLNSDGGYLWSCNFAIRRPVFEQVGGFDERFPHAAMEDVELRVRLRLAGFQPYFCPSAAVLHPWRRQYDLYRRSVFHVESVLVFNRLHPGEAVTCGHLFHEVARRYFKHLWGALRQYGWEAVPYHCQTLRADLYRFARLFHFFYLGGRKQGAPLRPLGRRE